MFTGKGGAVNTSLVARLKFRPGERIVETPGAAKTRQETRES